MFRFLNPLRIHEHYLSLLLFEINLHTYYSLLIWLKVFSYILEMHTYTFKRLGQRHYTTCRKHIGLTKFCAQNGIARVKNQLTEWHPSWQLRIECAQPIWNITFWEIPLTQSVRQKVFWTSTGFESAENADAPRWLRISRYTLE